MSNRNKPRLSLRGDPSAPTTAPIEQVQAAPSAPIQEKTMEAVQEKTQPEAPEQSGPTAKQMAEMEELNQVRALKIAQQQAEASIPKEDVPLVDIAARGYDALHEAFRKHNEQNKPKEYVPPARTPRQMQALQEELEAGRKAQERAQEQLDARPQAAPPSPNEGFTTPVYRPGDVVPDPTLPAINSVAGTRQYGPDAP